MDRENKINKLMVFFNEQVKHITPTKLKDKVLEAYETKMDNFNNNQIDFLYEVNIG